MYALRRRAIVMCAVALAALAGLALAWRYTSLSQFANAHTVTSLATLVASRPWTPVAVMAAYPVAALIMFPRPLITLFAVIAFGPVLGFVYAMLGIATSALSTYLVGRSLTESTVERLLTRRLREVRSLLQARGFIGSIAISIVPIAPFIVVGIAAGGMRIPVHEYIAGLLIGHLPGTLTTTIFGHQVKAMLENRASDASYLLILGAVTFFIVMIVMVRRWFTSQLAAPSAPTAPGIGTPRS